MTNGNRCEELQNMQRYMVGFHSVYDKWVSKVDVPSIGLETWGNWRRSIWNTNCVETRSSVDC